MATIEIVHEYRPKPGSHISKTAANIIGPALHRLAAQKEDALEPREVVQAARPKRSPLHPFFEWDDSVAADQYRVWQARHMLGSIEIKVVTRNGETREQFVRAFHNVTITRANREESIAEERAYVTLQTAISDEDYAAEIVNEAESELRAWSARYSQYKTLAQFGQRLGEVLEAVERLERVAA